MGLLIIACAGCSSDLPIHKQTPTPGGALNPDPEQPNGSQSHDFQQQPPTGNEAVKAPNW